MRVSDYKSRSPPTVQYRVRSYQSKEALKICMKGCFASEEHIVILTSHNAINPLCYTGKKKHWKYNISQPARAKQVFHRWRSLCIHYTWSHWDFKMGPFEHHCYSILLLNIYNKYYTLKHFSLVCAILIRELRQSRALRVMYVFLGGKWKNKMDPEMPVLQLQILKNLTTSLLKPDLMPSLLLLEQRAGYSYLDCTLKFPTFRLSPAKVIFKCRHSPRLDL